MPKSPWWSDVKLMKKRLSGFNGSARRYGHKPIKWATFEKYLNGLTEIGRAYCLSQCEWCRRPMERRNVSFDHRLPLVLKGAHSMGNIAFVDSTCNRLKSGMHPDQWLALVHLLQSQKWDGQDWFTIFRSSFRRSKWRRS